MTADEPLAGSTRRATHGLRQDVETMWSWLRAEFTPQDQFWVGFLSGAEAPEVGELVARSRNLSLSEVRRVDIFGSTGWRTSARRSARRSAGCSHHTPRTSR